VDEYLYYTSRQKKTPKKSLFNMKLAMNLYCAGNN